MQKRRNWFCTKCKAKFESDHLHPHCTECGSGYVLKNEVTQQVRKSEEMSEYSGAWRPVDRAEWNRLKASGEKVDWAEGAGLIVYDQRALDEFKARSEEIRRAIWRYLLDPHAG